jgi:hypothetical protein
MAEEDRITMSQKESNRLYVIRQAIEKAITQGQAAVLPDITERQVRRMIRNVREDDAAGICHKSRGRRAHNRIADKVKDKVTALCRDRYKEFGPTHASEKLLTIHHINVSDETLRRWFHRSKSRIGAVKNVPIGSGAHERPIGARWSNWTDPIATGRGGT